ncbi:MAG: lipoyl(octanoyl) transferase, partial [Bacteroidales bacterium]|nr:lipoyl(octanoyl) transferase [Bacteroidales bacterium]
MSLNILFEDLGVKDYKETWDYQETVFNEIIDYKRKPESERGHLNCPPNRLIFVEHPHVYTLGKSGSEGNLLIDPLQLQN